VKHGPARPAGRHDATASEIGDAEDISESYVRRTLRLAPLAPDLVDAIFAGRPDRGAVLENLERPLPGSCKEQRRSRLG
jgi:hypothetical protein